MAFQQILAVPGPLPINAQFNSPATGDVDFIITSTAWTSHGAGAIGIEVAINGQALGVATVYANQTSVHMTLPALFVTASLSSQQATITISPANANTTTDLNDVFIVNISY